MSLVLNGDTGVQGNSGAFVASTAVASTSGTSIDFTSIPSWVKRITVMFNGVSTNGTSNIQTQIGSGSVVTTGYGFTMSLIVNATASTSNSSTGFTISTAAGAPGLYSGALVLTLISSNTWVGTSVMSQSDSTRTMFGAGVSSALGGSLDRVRITTVNGTDTFDAGSINILYE